MEFLATVLVQLKKNDSISSLLLLLLLLFGCAMRHMEFSSHTGDQTCAPCGRSAES